MPASVLQYAGARASFTSIAPHASEEDGHTIPLNLVALVISFLHDDPFTLTALCRTSRVFYYMSLPLLWARVTLRSYSTIRYKDKDDTGLPEGFGSASPFSMGLNALVTHNVSAMVKNLALVGDWTARDIQEYSRVGRVSEQTMILNIAVRAVVDKCAGLESFKWDLNTKLQPNVYTGLASLKSLKKLHIRFPSSRSPQPSGELPALPNLQSFIFTDYDPLCFPDDISRLLLNARKLQELQFHFSPRMREAGEPSVQISHFFRKNIAARRKLRLRKLGLYNLFARAESPEVLSAIDTSSLMEITSLNTFGKDEDTSGGPGDLSTGFLDSTWLEDVHAPFGVMKTIRIDQLHKAHADGILKGCERLYLVNARYGKPDLVVESPMESTPSDQGGSAQRSASRTPSSSLPGVSASTKLRDLYFNQICDHTGTTLKHLIFPARWGLDINQMARLIRSCPNLTQLSCFFDCLKLDMMRMLVPFLKKLWAIRLIIPQQCATSCETVDGKDQFEDEGEQERKIRTELAHGDMNSLRYIGLGRYIWEVGGVEQVMESMPVEPEGQALETDKEEQPAQCQEQMVWRRKIKRLTLEDVQDIEIWKCDTLSVV